MKNNLAFKIICLSILTCTWSLPYGRANLAYHVLVNTAPLQGNLGAPFSIDFQLTDGSGTLAGPNTVVLSNFIFGSGGAIGSPTLFGGTSGSLTSTVTLTDSSDFFNEFYQSFMAGSKLEFDVLLTTNVAGLTPDAFSFSILDNSLFNITTTGLGNSLMLVNINSPTLGLNSIQTFASTSPSGVTVTVSGPSTGVPDTLPWGGTATTLLVMFAIFLSMRYRQLISK